MMGLGVQAYGTWPSDLEFIAAAADHRRSHHRRPAGRHGSYVTAAHG